MLALSVSEDGHQDLELGVLRPPLACPALLRSRQSKQGLVLVFLFGKIKICQWRGCLVNALWEFIDLQNPQGWEDLS